MKKESDIDALVKIIRLIANLFTVNEIGQDIYVNRGIHFKDLIRKLKELLEKKCNLVQHADLIVCNLSCMANALFYDREVLMSNTLLCRSTMKRSVVRDYVYCPTSRA
jgi:ABC-type transporter Mla maintaining outer membrane lipid asymmetry ATPase subunit MlaF